MSPHPSEIEPCAVPFDGAGAAAPSRRSVTPASVRTPVATVTTTGLTL